jgi:hypothetical protein
MSSRRTSFSSDGGRSRDSRHGPFFSPFDDSRPTSRAGSSDDDQVNTQTVAQKYNIMPSEGLLLFPEDVEQDDWLHNPDPNEKEQNDCNVFTRRGMVNVGGLAFITLGIIMLFVGYPILYVRLHLSGDMDANELQIIRQTTHGVGSLELCYKSRLPFGIGAIAAERTKRTYRSRYSSISDEEDGI